MARLSTIACAAALVVLAMPAVAADDILDTIDQARKAYQAGDAAAAKQSLDLASQLIAQKNAEAFVALLPAALPGWKADKAQANAMGGSMFGGASAASRAYSNDKGDSVEVSITGDSAMLMQFSPVMNNPAMAGAMGKLIRVGSQRAIQSQDGDILMMSPINFSSTCRARPMPPASFPTRRRSTLPACPRCDRRQSRTAWFAQRKI